MYQEFYDRINLNVKLEEISKILCDKYKLGNYISDELILVGYEDFNYILTSTNGKYCVKIFNKDRTDEDVNNYIDRIELASSLNINTPKVYKIDNNCLQIINFNINCYRLCIFEYIDGSSFYDLNEIPTDIEIKDIIRQMICIHQTKLESNYIYDKWTITNFIKEYENKKMYLDSKYIDIFDNLSNKFKMINFDKLPHSFVHGDIISSNVMKDKNNKLWIIDFAVSNYLPRIVDLAVTSCNLCLNPNDKIKTIESIKMILEEYQKYMKLTEYELQDKIKIKLITLYLFLFYIIK